MKILKEFTAEVVGTCVLLMFGCGCVAQSLLSNKENGTMLSINLGWGFGVLMGIMIAGPISGEEDVNTNKKKESDILPVAMQFAISSELFTFPSTDSLQQIFNDNEIANTRLMRWLLETSILVPSPHKFNTFSHEREIW